MKVLTTPFGLLTAGSVSINPVVTASAYSANNNVGGLQTLSGLCRTPGGGAKLDEIVVTDKSNQKPPLTFLFYGQPPAATVTDKTAVALKTDAASLIGRVDVATADYATVGSDSLAVAHLKGLNLLLQNNEPSGKSDIYLVVVTSGTPTFASTGDLSWVFKIKEAY